MKKWLLGAALAVISAVAFALPSPHQIEDALASHDYDTAKSMTQEVLRERPDSAKAHLFDAFLLEHVDGNLAAASQELQNVQNLDQRGDVKNSALFGKTVAEIDAKGQVVRQAQQTSQVNQVQAVSPVTSYVAPEKHSGHGFLIFLFVGLIVALLVWLFIRGATRRQPIKQTTYYDDNSLLSGSSGLNRVGSSGSGRAYISSPSIQPAIVHTPYVQPVQSGPVIINNGGGYGRGYGNDGFTEGLVMGELLEDSRESRRERRDSDSWGRDSSYNSTPVVSGSSYSSSSSDSSSSLSSPVERSSYSSGSDDSWSSRSSSSDYSSSSSSSYDSGSSSSSWDSGSSSSYDSGSFSSGGDSSW
jgi:hypothetical protein